MLRGLSPDLQLPCSQDLAAEIVHRHCFAQLLPDPTGSWIPQLRPSSSWQQGASCHSGKIYASEAIGQILIKFGSKLRNTKTKAINRLLYGADFVHHCWDPGSMSKTSHCWWAQGHCLCCHIPQLKLLPLVSLVLFRLSSFFLLQGEHESMAFYPVGQGWRSALLFFNICSVLNAGWVLYKGAFRAALTGQAGR